MVNIPNDSVIEQMENILNVASDFTRLKIMYALFDGEKCVNEIISAVDCSQSLVSHQLAVLKKARIVSIRKEKTKVYYSLDDDHIKTLIHVIYEHVSEN